MIKITILKHLITVLVFINRNYLIMMWKVGNKNYIKASDVKLITFLIRWRDEHKLSSANFIFEVNLGIIWSNEYYIKTNLKLFFELSMFVPHWGTSAWAHALVPQWVLPHWGIVWHHLYAQVRSQPKSTTCNYSKLVKHQIYAAKMNPGATSNNTWNGILSEKR